MAEPDPVPPPPTVPSARERRRNERRTDIPIADLSVPEFSRILITSLLFVIVVSLFFWMVRTVLIAAILAVVIAAYLRPLYRLVRKPIRSDAASATITLIILIIPVLGALFYSYTELVNVLKYISSHQTEISTQIDAALRRLPLPEGAVTAERIRGWVVTVSDYGEDIPAQLKGALATFSISAAVFLFTAFYVFTEAGSIVNYVREKIPPRYSRLQGILVTNVRGVLYGAIYATLVTQAAKSAIIFVLNLVFGVPLAGVLAILSFIIGFFPIVGSWSVYVPVALWLLVFRGNTIGAVLMFVVGMLLNTLFISMYLRPKLAAERSGVLNFFWMFVGLVTGVYTFGLAGILLGPLLIGVLKAVIDSVTATASWHRDDTPDEDPVVAAGGAS